ncbi:MAG: hypothetical protein JWP42_2233 [Pseudomonas sp.]|nr:hypothetical protein [Pseudomonas sp.]
MEDNNLRRPIGTDLSPRVAKLNYSSGGVIDRYESIYAVLSRFALANRLSKRELVNLFKSGMRARYSGSKGLGDMALINAEQAMRWLGISQSQLKEMFFSWRPGLKVPVGCLYFRYCSICASAHRHYTIFQAEALSRCPFHSIPLRTACAYCGESMLYNWNSTLLKHPFRCAHCRKPLGVQHGCVVFFDLHTITRAHRIGWANGQRTAAQSLNRGAVEECPGYIVCGFRGGDFEQWCAMVKLPLYGHDWDDRDWSSCAGYIQIRGARIRSSRKRCSTKAASAHPEVAGDLMQCLKAVLRHLRKRWHIARLAGNTRDGLPKHREEAYRLLLTHWCGSPSERYVGGEGGRRSVSLSVINAWLCGFAKNADAHAVPLSVTAWFLTHQFCDWVVESITTIARLIDRPPSIPDACLLEQVQRPRKPLWLVAFVEPASFISYRVLHYHHYPVCLSNAELWFGSSDGGKPVRSRANL